MKKWIIYSLAMVMLLCFIGCEKEITNEEITSENKVIENITEHLNDENYVWIDTRMSDAFNGWDLDGKPGHLENAINFSASWLSEDEKVLLEWVNRLDISKEKHLVFYDIDLTKANDVLNFFKEQGYVHLYVYDLNEWESPLVQYENYELIVPASIVAAIIEGKQPESFEEAKEVKIVEASWGGAENSYDKGHIPTAFHINTDEIEPPTTEEPIMWMLATDDVLENFALTYGFQNTDTVIVTGEEQMAAYRVAMVLKYLGVQDVRVLNGGTKAWTSAGYELEKTGHMPTPVETFGADIPGRPDIIETVEELQVSLTQDDFTLVDNRTREEFIGESTGYSYHNKAGRIEGAKFGFAGFENAYSLSYYRNPDLTMVQPEIFIELWQGQNIDINNRLAFMCGSGWRAAEIYYYADVYGLKNISLYSDGWIGWSNRGLPYVVGDDNN